MFESEFFLDDRHEDIDSNGDPDLRLHGVLGGTVEGLDSEVLLYPPEEEFHFPSRLVQLCDDVGGEGEVVGEQNKAVVGIGIVVMNSENRGQPPILISHISTPSSSSIFRRPGTQADSLAGVF